MKFQCKNCQAIFDQSEISTPMDLGDWIYIADCCPECKEPYEWFIRRKDLYTDVVPPTEKELEEARDRTILMLGATGPIEEDKFMVLRYFADRIIDGDKEEP